MAGRNQSPPTKIPSPPPPGTPCPLFTPVLGSVPSPGPQQRRVSRCTSSCHQQRTWPAGTYTTHNIDKHIDVGRCVWACGGWGGGGTAQPNTQGCVRAGRAPTCGCRQQRGLAGGRQTHEYNRGWTVPYLRMAGVELCVWGAAWVGLGEACDSVCVCVCVGWGGGGVGGLLC